MRIVIIVCFATFFVNAQHTQPSSDNLEERLEPEEQIALDALYNTLGIRHREVLEYRCFWKGVTCLPPVGEFKNEYRYIVALNLRGLAVGGLSSSSSSSFPLHMLLHFTRLKQLDLSENEIGKSIGENRTLFLGLPALSKLLMVRVTMNTGVTIPELPQSIRVFEFSLRENANNVSVITFPSSWAELTKVKEMRIRGVGAGDVFPCTILCNWAQVRIIDLSGNKFPYPYCPCFIAAKLKNLIYLNVSGSDPISVSDYNIIRKHNSKLRYDVAVSGNVTSPPTLPPTLATSSSPTTLFPTSTIPPPIIPLITTPPQSPLSTTGPNGSAENAIRVKPSPPVSSASTLRPDDALDDNDNVKEVPGKVGSEANGNLDPATTNLEPVTGNTAVLVIAESPPLIADGAIIILLSILALVGIVFGYRWYTRNESAGAGTKKKIFPTRKARRKSSDV